MSGTTPNTPHAPDAPDALVIVLHSDSPLEVLERSGLIQREWALYQRLQQHVPNMVLVSPGGHADRPIFERLIAAHGCSLVDNPAAEHPNSLLPQLGARVLAALPTTARTVVVKTNQHRAGDFATAVAAHLWAAGLKAPLIARGGYPFSQFAARDFGPSSVGAIQAAEAEARLFAAASLVVGTTVDMLADLAWRHHLDPARLALIPNYVNTAAIPPPVPRDPSLVLYAGRLEPQKRVDLLIHALAHPTLRSRATRLSIVGEGSQEPALRALAASLGVRATFEPRLSHAELLTRMRRCAVYAQTSAFEGHPKTVLEALAVAAPVVICDVPGMRGVVEPGRTGLVAAHHPAAVAAAIAQLLANPVTAAALGQAAADAIARTSSLDRVVELELDAYRRAVATTQGRVDSAPRAAVRWEPTLASAAPDQQRAAWSASLVAFARRQPDPAQFLRDLHNSAERALASVPVHNARKDQSPPATPPMLTP